MKLPDELIPRIRSHIKELAELVEKRIVVESDLKKYIRIARIKLEELDKLLVELRNSFTKKLGYFPEDGSKTISDISKEIRDLVAKFREWENKYHTDISKKFEELKSILNTKAKEFLEKIEKL